MYNIHWKIIAFFQKSYMMSLGVKNTQLSMPKQTRMKSDCVNCSNNNICKQMNERFTSVTQYKAKDWFEIKMNMLPKGEFVLYVFGKLHVKQAAGCKGILVTLVFCLFRKNDSKSSDDMWKGSVKC